MKKGLKDPMERYMLHLKNEGYTHKNSRELVYKARDLASGMDVSIRVCRIATKFIELDVSIDENKLDLLLEKLAPIGPVDNVRHVLEEEIEKEQGIQDGIFYFNNERFWESHEAFEGVWKKCFGREKELVQGIILLAVAFAHVQKNEIAIGIGMLSRAIEKLGTSPSLYHSIDVDRMRTKIVQMQLENQLTLFEI